jgi:signal transduction histidine kinase
VIRRLPCAVIFALLALLMLDGTAWAQDQKQVLVLYSTRRDAQIVVVGERELPRILDEAFEQRVDYYSEYIDEARFPDPKYRTGFHDFVKLKYQGQRFDVVIAMSDLALQFVAVNRQEFFPDTPVVYFANSPDTQRVENSTGVLSQLDLTGTLQLATALQPDLQHVFVVSGLDAGDDNYLAMARSQFKPFEQRLTVTYFSGLATKDLEARLSALPAQSMVYYLFVNRDGAGQNFHPLEYLDHVSMVANAPVYSWVDSALDHGIIGGSLKSQLAETQALGRLAVRVLSGEHADGIPISSRDLYIPQVDFRQLQRWGIDEGRLPVGTIVRFREPGIWDRYKIYILGAAGVVLVQFALIAGLLIQRVRRRSAEGELRGSQDALRTSYERIRDLGGRLLHAQESERARIARELHDDISQQMSLLMIDLGLMRGRVGPQTQELSNEVMNRAEGIVKSVHDLSHRLHPPKLRLIGLVAALRDLQHEMSQLGVPITFTHENVPLPLPPEVTLCLFRVVQEALQNAQKYSHAQHVSVQLRGDTEGLALTVSDDGVGFDLDQAWGRGLGLISMGERLEAVGGTFKISSKPGDGTKVHVFVPLSAVQAADTVSV